MDKYFPELVVFLIPPEQFIGGGIISIFSLCEEARRLAPPTTSLMIATYPGTKSYGKNTAFKNDEIIYDFEDVIKKMKLSNSMILHIPEYSVARIAESLREYKSALRKVSNLQINILNQNVKMMPNEEVVSSLLPFTSNITQTTAHARYTTQAVADRYRTPVHLFSVKIDRKQYIHKSFQQKNNSILISPDPHPLKEKLIENIKKETDLEVIHLDGLTFEDYKKAIANAKFTVTFGEGLDGYFIESTYSDSVGFAVFNKDFFPNNDYLKLSNIYKDYETLVEKLPAFLAQLSRDQSLYEETSSTASKLLEKLYNEDQFKTNVRNFYEKKYSFLPKTPVDAEFLTNIIYQKDGTIGDQRQSLAALEAKNEANNQAHDQEIDRLKGVVDELYVTINRIEHSTSWKVTKPIRQVGKLVKRKRRSN